ncbi:M24 family metallopeptidase [Acerihabitans arboris]|uniref:M24 family metallopeptidase n=1 Tax=Acerihabitans arboris TaxID=2691583 RepID=A0A845SJC1_9GAMM|nr:M24 family metallopeptidase [Acerihabitans arboris]NDL64039.1 M24 family metallopeptidase [Acerihabitans arboris]
MPLSLPPMKPAWAYRPGPDVAPEAPAGLRRAQQLAKAGAQAGLAAVAPGVTESAVEAAIHDYLRAHGAEGIWTITNVGLGENTKVCFPTQGPGAQAAAARDVLMVDVHPIVHEGFWGDCTRCRVIGDYPEATAALRDLENIHRDTLALCRPGMPASELFGLSQERLGREGFILLDLLGNIGHSLTAGAAYTHGFIDAGNDTPMWGAWAIEPFAQRGDVAVKVEDVVWFGRERCEIL